MSECSISRFAIYYERLYSGISGEAAVDRQNHARDKACSLIVYKEEKSALQLLGFTESAHGSCGKYLARSCGGSTVGIEERQRSEADNIVSLLSIALSEDGHLAGNDAACSGDQLFHGAKGLAGTIKA